MTALLAHLLAFCILLKLPSRRSTLEAVLALHLVIHDDFCIRPPRSGEVGFAILMEVQEGLPGAWGLELYDARIWLDPVNIPDINNQISIAQASTG